MGLLKDTALPEWKSLLSPTLGRCYPAADYFNKECLKIVTRDLGGAGEPVGFTAASHLLQSSRALACLPHVRMLHEARLALLSARSVALLDTRGHVFLQRDIERGASLLSSPSARPADQLLHSAANEALIDFPLDEGFLFFYMRLQVFYATSNVLTHVALQKLCVCLLISHPPQPPKLSSASGHMKLRQYLSRADRRIFWQGGIQPVERLFAVAGALTWQDNILQKLHRRAYKQTNTPYLTYSVV